MVIKDTDIIDKYKDELNFIITDHHSLLSSKDKSSKTKLIGQNAVPKAAKAVTHPGLGTYPFRDICGAVVSWKVCSAINSILELNVDINKYLDLAMLGTVCDIMPLVDENRAIVRLGLEQLRKTENHGLKALLKVCGINSENIQSFHIGYVLGPRLNAAGRLGDATDSVRLLTTKSESKALKLAEKLDRLNKKRQVLTQEFLIKAEKIIDKEKKKKVYFVVGEEWPEGIVGLIAGNLTNKYNRPVLVATKIKKVLKGSARSIENFNIAMALKKLEHNLIKHGGHSGAAGFQLDHSALPSFKEELENYVNKNLNDSDLEKLLFVDSKINFRHINFNTINDLLNFEPFGQSNPEPNFAFLNIQLSNYQRFGKNNQHLKIYPRERSDLEFIGFNSAERFYPLLSPNVNLNIVGTLGTNEWNGKKLIQIRIQDIKKTP